MRRLRVEDPWKAEQTHDSLKRYLLEESYEVLEAIDAYDPATGEGADELCSELGDLLYQVVFHSSIGAEAGWFTLADVARSHPRQAVRRHPHLLATTEGRPGPAGVDELVAAWEVDKQAEQGRESVIDGIPAALPALARAMKVVQEGREPRLPRGGVAPRRRPRRRHARRGAAGAGRGRPHRWSWTPRMRCRVATGPTRLDPRCAATRRPARAGGRST